ncbi:MAG TPA: flagellar motor protein MotB [Bryobacteraceae bacterium]|nr:flagellar motor protein MotB [Bryobacteraceae bacterium]
MARKKQAQHDNHDRWLVSYADFITLLFAFFVMMFASSQTDRGKAQQVSESVRKALEETHAVSRIVAILGGSAKDAGKGDSMAAPKDPGAPNETVVDLLPSLEFLSRELSAEIRAGKMQINLEPRGLVVSLPQATFFPSGQDTIDPATYAVIEKVSAAIRKIPNPVRLEGHTDSVPIHNVRFRSNWELSAARSIAMLELLAVRYEIPRERLAVAGYADTVPAEPNDSEEGRARNRRVDIVVLSRIGLMREPEPGARTEPPPSAKGPKGA